MRMRVLLTLLLLLIATAGLLLFARPVFAPEPYTLREQDVVQLVFAPNSERPYMVTRAGELFEPAGESWEAVTVDGTVYDVYPSADGTLYAASSEGVLRRREGVWEQVTDMPPARELDAMHGFLFALGDQGAARTIQGESEDQEWRVLEVPAVDLAARDLVMLADHSHVILNGGDVALTDDMGLSWELIGAPEGIRQLAADPQARLLAITGSGIARWLEGDRWEEIAMLPTGVMPDALRVFQDQLYALAAGRLMRLDGNRWSAVPLQGVPDAYLTAIAVHQLNTLWVADASTQRLWTTTDLQNWSEIVLP